MQKSVLVSYYDAVRCFLPITIIDSDKAIKDLVTQLIEYNNMRLVGGVLNIRRSTVARFKLNKRHELVRFWMSTSPYASCEGLAGLMYNMKTIDERARRSVENGNVDVCFPLNLNCLQS